MKSFQVTDFNAPLTEVDAPTPQPSGTQVLIRVKAAGVCHSDLHIWEGGYNLGHGRQPLSLKDRGVSLPLTMGHETVGEVVALGPDAKDIEGDIKVGDVALVYPWIGCGQCEVCLAGEENMCLKPRSLGVYCDGGYADHMTVPHPRYLLDLKGLDPVTAAPYACSGVTTYSALKKIEADLGSPIVIFGAGGLGLMALSLLKAMGGKGAIVVELDARKREAAEAAGALATVDGAAPDALAQLAAKAKGPIKAVIDLVGKCADGSVRFRLPDQGRQAGHGRPVRRRRAVGVAFDSDQGPHHPGQLCRQPARDERTARPGAHQEGRADPGDPDAVRQGQPGAGGSAAGQVGRPRGVDAHERMISSHWRSPPAQMTGRSG
jgi:alcohol dehydrogenase/propanol-preferring alcohol dehydrogenase